MKKIMAMLLALGVAVSMFGCGTQANEPQTTQATQPAETVAPTVPVEFSGYTVASPLEYPDYTFDHTPTTDELRQMAIKAMADMLSVQWSVETYTYYRKSSTGSNKIFEYLPVNTYAGLPYSNADGSIVQFFEFYDPETGRINVGGDGQVLNESIGNTCAGSVCAAWSTVCAGIESSCGSANLTVKYGFIPVGGYTSPYLDSFNTYSTELVLRDNGKEVMYACYAQIQPADGLTSTPDVHTIMAIEPAHVVYKADGSIDPDASYVAIQDQRMGVGDVSYAEQTEAGPVFYTGRLRAEYTFTELWDLGYIPITMPEFVGERAYEEAVVTFSESDCTTVEQMEKGVITSNYPMCVIKLCLTDDMGEKTIVERILLDKFDIPTGAARTFRVEEFLISPDSNQLKSMLQTGKNYTLSIEVSVSNAQVFVPVSVTVTG